MKHFLFAILILLNSYCYSQDINPGGVHGSVFWFQADTKDRNIIFKNAILQNYYVLPENNTGISLSSMNYHPSVTFSNHGSFSMPVPDSLINKGSFFIVYGCTDTIHENILWQINNRQSTSLVSTTDRLADLSLYSYMNFYDVTRGQPKVNIYEHQRDSVIISTGNRMYIGIKPASPVLPVSDFTGTIPEFLAFGKVLNSEERIKVASYLSLKYGITLAEPGGTYLNSAGEAIWDGLLYPAYHHNIAGLGRDDSSGLVQQTATSSNSAGMLTLSAVDSISDNSFLVCGENDLPFAVQDSDPDNAGIYKKNWLFVPHNWPAGKAINISVDTKKIDDYISPAESLWAAIDNTGDGSFSFDNTDYVRMNLSDKNGLAFFNNIKPAKSNDEKFNIGFRKGGELLVVKNILTPQCNPLSDGSISVKAFCENYPVSIQLLNSASGITNKYSAHNNAPYIFDGLQPGHYLLSATDAAGNTSADSFFVNNADAPHPANIQPHYSIAEGETLVLNAGYQMPLGTSFLWQGSDNFLSASPVISISKKGSYSLACTENSCSYFQEISVTKKTANPFRMILIYPNPSGEYFTAKVSLAEPADMYAAVYTNDGKMVLKKQMKGMANYTFSDHLFINGIYHVVFMSGGFTESRKLIIEK